MVAYVKKSIGLGAVPNDDTGSTLIVGGGIINDNNDEIFGATDYEAGGAKVFKYEANGIAQSQQGIKFGGTSASNLINDFQSGEYFPVLTAETSGTITLNTIGDSLAIKKIGNTCWVKGQILVLSVAAPVGALSLSLPFLVPSLTDGQEISAGSVGYGGLNALGSAGSLIVRVETSGAKAIIVEQTTTTLLNDVADHIKANSFLWFDFSFTTV